MQKLTTGNLYTVERQGLSTIFHTFIEVLGRCEQDKSLSNFTIVCFLSLYEIITQIFSPFFVWKVVRQVKIADSEEHIRDAEHISHGVATDIPC